MNTNYLQKLFIRYLFALFFVLLGFKIINTILGPITFYISYLSLTYFSPELISSTSFIINQIKLTFIPACNATGAYVLLIILTLTTELPLKKYFKILLQGFFIIFIFNLIRIDLLIYLLINGFSELFETLHLFFWKILSTIFVVFLWIFLTRINKIENIPFYTDYKKIIKILKQSKR